MASTTASTSPVTSSQSDLQHHSHQQHHQVINASTMPSNIVANSSGSSSSISSLFERVSNFRRSLIKNQTKKNKIRPSSGSFNFFKPNSSSNLSSIESNSIKFPKNGISSSSSSSSSSGQYGCEPPLETSKNGLGASGSTSAASASNLRHSIIVDDEDAIYGFTSLHLNNQTSLRRQLKQSTLDSGKKNMHGPSSSSPSQMFTSSSCISLYETIDEVEPLSGGNSSPPSENSGDPKSLPPPLPPSNPKHFQSSYSKFRSTSHSSRQLRLSSMHDSDWKRNRRSSAIIFGSDFHDLIVDDSGGDDHEPTSMIASPGGSASTNGHHQNGYQQSNSRYSHPANGSMVNGNGHHHHPIHSNHSFLHHHPMNRSSDDLLLMTNRSHHYLGHHQLQHDSSSTSDPVRPYFNGATNSRIYENLANGSLANSHNHHHHHHKRSDNNRKLTKDSGYESASTLVSLTQLNSLSAQQSMSQSSPQPLTPLPPPCMSSGMGHAPNQNGLLISQIATLHSRSDSIDSANSLDHHLQSPSPPIPKCLDSHAESPPLPPPPPPSTLDVMEDSRPPTPPVRYSSLPQNRSFLHRNPTSDIVSSNGSIDRHVRAWQAQVHPAFDGPFDSHQIDQLSSRQLRCLASDRASPPLPPPPSAMDMIENSLLEYHHVKQESWPSFVSNSRSNSSSASSPNGSRRRHTARSMMPIPTDYHSTKPYQRQQSFGSSSGQPYYHSSSSGSSTVITQSPSLSSLSNMIAHSTSVRHSIASCSTNNTSNATNGYSNYQPVPAQQIARSHRVQQVPRQELCVPPLPQHHRVSLETSLDDVTNSDGEELSGDITPPPPPPPLPPKSASNSPITTCQNYLPKSDSKNDLVNTKAQQPRLSLTPKSSPEHSPPASTSSPSTSEIKAIQKRAVYEFYLRQKEKKEKASMSNRSTSSPSRSNSGSSSEGSLSRTATSPINEDCNSTNRQPPCNDSKNYLNGDKNVLEPENCDIVDEDLPLPTPPPPLPMTQQPNHSEPNRFFGETSSANTFPPPPTPVVMESPSQFPSPPTPLHHHQVISPSFPPPPTPLSSSVTPFEGIIRRPTVTRQMFHSIDLSTLWPLIDFSRLFQLLPPPPLKESNLDESDNEDDLNNNDEVDEELVSIEQNRERQLQLDWQMSQLTTEQARIELELGRNESIVGAMLQVRLQPSGQVDRNKLELLVNDMIMIIRLMVSIVQQLTRNELQMQQQRKQQSKVLSSNSNNPVKTKENNLTVDCNETSASTTSGSTVSNANDVVNNRDGGADAADDVHCSADEEVVELCQQKRTRLLSQLEEAKRLRDNIETRRTMLEQRLARKCAAAAKNGNIAANGSSGVGDGGGQTSNGVDGYQLPNGSDMTTTAAAAAGLLLSDDIDLTTLIRYYLDAKEHLLVQQEVSRLLHDDLKWRIETQVKQ